MTEHINRYTGKNLKGEKVDQSALPWLHIYSQPFEHADAVIVGNILAIYKLTKALEDFLNRFFTLRNEFIIGGFFATDGEGYSVKVKVLPDSPGKLPMVPNPWDKYPPHYCDQLGRYDDATSSPTEAIAAALRRLADAVEKVGEKHQAEIDDWADALTKDQMVLNASGHELAEEFDVRRGIADALYATCPHRIMADEPGKPDISLRKKFECPICREEILGRFG